MRKLSLLALVAFVSGAAFAQDAPAVKRTFRVYMDAISGNMIAAKPTDFSDADLFTENKTYTLSDGGKVWQGSEFEIGMVYGQNWAKVPWLTTSFALKLGINPTWSYRDDQIVSGNTYLTPGSQYGTTFGRSGESYWVRGQVTLDFSKYFSFYMDSRLLMGFTGQYAWTSGAHSLGFQLGLELFAGNYSLSGAKYKNMRQGDGGITSSSSPTTRLNPFAPNREGAAGPIIDAVWFDITWTAKMPMGFANTILIRPVGFGGDNGYEIAEKFYIRLQETLSWSNAGFSIYARIRYNIKNIAFPSYDISGGSGMKYKLGIIHDLSLRAGLSYSYDFSKL